MAFSFKKMRSFRFTIIATVVLTLTLQIIRVILPIGIADIDNVILYTLGSLVGFVLYKNVIKIVENIKL